MNDDTVKTLIPWIRKTFPTITAKQIVGVQPMGVQPMMKNSSSPKFWKTNDPLTIDLSIQLDTQEFKDWCSNNNFKIIKSELGFGRCITFQSEEEKLLFLLRWA